MIKNRKAMMVEALMRIVIMVVLVVIVFNIGKKAAEAAFGGSDSLQSSENFVKEINLIEGGGKEVLLSMDEGTAVIGFNKNTKEFRCYGCQQVYGQAFSSTLLYYSIKKPSNDDCNNKPCVCICLKGFSASPFSGSESKINCERYSCKTLNQDIYSKISLESALKKRNIQIATYPYWENGFFFVRRKGTETPLNGMVPPNDISKITVFVEKKKIGQEIYVAACPALPCIQEQK